MAIVFIRLFSKPWKSLHDGLLPFSKHWKNMRQNFHTLESFLPIFSKHWKNKRQLFQCLETKPYSFLPDRD